MPKVIEWVNPGPDDIVWKYPSETIEWGSILIVREYEAAVFYRDGKVYDVFRAGRHVITTLNLPLLTKVLSRISGYDKVPFQATIIFVSLRQFRGLFGGRTQTTELAPLMFRGSYYFRVADPAVFVNEVVGGQSLYTTDDINDYLRSFMNELLMKYLSTYSIVDVFMNLDRVSTEVKLKLLEDFKRLGLELIDVKFEGVDTTEEWRQKLFWIRQTGNAAMVLQMETAKAVASALGKSPSASAGTGIVMIPPLLYGPYAQAQQGTAPQAGGGAQAPTTQTAPQTQQAQQKFFCPYCGAEVPPKAKFCPNCGKRLKWCPNGHLVPAEAKVCPICGYRFSE